MSPPRQPEPVTITISGDQRDVVRYADKIRRIITNNSYDNVIFDHEKPVPFVTRLTIYPGAVNE